MGSEFWSGSAGTRNDAMSSCKRTVMKDFVENGLIYFLKTKNFLKNKKIYSSKWKYIETELYESLDINNLNDLKIARLLYNKTK